MKILVIIASFFTKLGEVLGTFWGWIVTAFFFLCDFYAGFGFAFLSVGLLIMMDTIAGIWAAIKQKKYVRSELMRDMFSKIALYGAALIAVCHIEMLNHDTTFVTYVIATAMCCTEFWSFGGNALIINPNLTFFKLLRPALIGEIARKLGRSEEEVKEALNNNEKLIK